jgi:hypothetical protein
VDVQTRRFSLALAMLVWLTNASASATPSLRVRAQVGIELHAVYAGAVLRLDGTIHDDLGAPLANRELTAHIEPLSSDARVQRRRLRSDEQGRFQLESSSRLDVACRVTVEFEGDAFYERAASSQIVETQRAELRLHWRKPDDLRVSIDQPSVHLAVQASSAIGGAGVRVVFENELAQVIGSGMTDADGALDVQVESTALGAPGLGELVARSAGDAQRTAARSGKPVLRMRATRLALSATYDASHTQLALAVELTTHAGPVAERAVGLFMDDRHLVTLITDEHGRAARTLTPAEAALPEGQHQLRARFEADVPGLASSRSPALALTFAPAPHPDALFLIVPAIASLAFALWTARRSRAERLQEVRVPPEAPEVRFGTPARGRSAPLFTCSGTIEDVDSGEPLSALLTIAASSGATTEVASDLGGRFMTPKLPADSYQLTAHVEGYAPTAFSLVIPHHGTGANMTVSLRSLRALALEAYAPLAQRVLRSEQRLQTATVREALAAAISGRRAGPTLATLTESVERTAYAAPIPHADDLEELQRGAAIALDEIAIRSPAPEDPGLGR